MITCEWCEARAVVKIAIYKSTYERFSCAAHRIKTLNLVRLDNGITAEIELFAVVSGERKTFKRTKSKYQKVAKREAIPGV